MKSWIVAIGIGCFAACMFLTTGISAQTQWVRTGNIINGLAAGDNAGTTVSMNADGSVIAVGYPYYDNTFSDAGLVRIFQLVSGTWVPVGNAIEGLAAGENTGVSVSLNAAGTVVAIGSPGNDIAGTDAGCVRVYEYSSGVWSLKGNVLYGEAVGDGFGSSVSINSDGNSVAVGAPNNSGSGTNAGHVRVFTYSSGTWVQRGSDIDGEMAGDNSGRSVKIGTDGLSVTIGAPGNDGSASNAGHVRVFAFISGSWQQLGADINGDAASDLSGFAVSSNAYNSVVAVGSYFSSAGGSNRGKVKVFQYSGGVWSQMGGDIIGDNNGDWLGYSVSLSPDGTKLAVGAIFNDGTLWDAGYVKIFQFSYPNWVQVGNTVFGTDANNVFGYSVAINSDGSGWMAGAPWNDAAGADAGQARVFRTCQKTYSTDVHTACDAFSWIDGNTYTSSNTTATDTLVNAAGCDSIVTLNLTILGHSVTTDNQVACDSFYWSANGQTYDYSVTTNATLVNVNGCDSFVTLNLTVYSPQIVGQPSDIIVPVDSDAHFIVSASFGVDDYQWQMDPGTGFQNISNGGQFSGATTQELTVAATIAGNDGLTFRCIVSQGPCSVVSDTALLTVTTTENIRIYSSDKFSVFPVPASNELHIATGEIVNDLPFYVLDIAGRIVLSGNLADSSSDIDILHLEDGYYFINIEGLGCAPFEVRR